MQIDQLVTHDLLHYFIGNDTGTVTGIEERMRVFQLVCGIGDHAEIFIAVILLHHVKTAEYRIRFTLVQCFIRIQDIRYAVMGTAAE